VLIFLPPLFLYAHINDQVTEVEKDLTRLR